MSAEPAWTYSLADRAFDFLADGETLTLTYMAQVDTNYSEYNTVVLKPFTITVAGTNDLPTIAATGSAFIELLGTNNALIDHAEGAITFADVDLTDRPTVDGTVRELRLYGRRRFAADADAGAGGRARGGADPDAGGDQHPQRIGGMVV